MLTPAVADLAVDVRPQVGVVAVQRHRVERGGQPLGRHPFAEQLEALVGAERIALAREHARRVLVLALEREHAGGVREAAGNVFQQHPAQQFAVVLVVRQRDLADLGAGQRGRRQLGAQLAVADLDDVLVARVGLLHLRPHVEQLPARLSCLASRSSATRSTCLLRTRALRVVLVQHARGLRAAAGARAQAWPAPRRASCSRAPCRRSPRGSACAAAARPASGWSNGVSSPSAGCRRLVFKPCSCSRGSSA